MKKLICIISIVCMLFSTLSITSFAWLTKNDRYLESSSSKDGTANSSTFKDEGLPAPIVKAPVPHAVSGQINIKLDGNYQFFYDLPVLTDGRVLLPFREIFRMFGMRVTWVSETETAIAKNDNSEIKITVDNEKAYVNNEEKTLDVPAKIIKDRVYVPVRFIAENLNCRVSWDNRTQTVNIFTNGGVVQ